MAKPIKQASELERIGLKLAFEVQRDLWKEGSVDQVSQNHGIDRLDVEAISFIQARMKEKLPASVEVVPHLPWTLDPDRLKSNRIIPLFEKSMARLRNPRLVRRSWLKLPPAIPSGGMKLVNAERLLSILPEDTMYGGTVLVTAAPPDVVNDPLQCSLFVGSVLARHMGDDIQIDKGIRAYEDGYRVKLTRADVDGAIDYAASAMAAATVAVTLHRSICLLHAGFNGNRS